MSLPSFSLSQLGGRPFFAQQITLDEAGALMPARVIAMHRTVLDTLTEGGELQATLAGSISEQALSASLAVGDLVLVERRTGRAVRALARRSALAREAGMSCSSRGCARWWRCATGSSRCRGSRIGHLAGFRYIFEGPVRADGSVYRMVKEVPERRCGLRAVLTLMMITTSASTILKKTFIIPSPLPPSAGGARRFADAHLHATIHLATRGSTVVGYRIAFPLPEGSQAVGAHAMASQVEPD